MDRDQSRLHWLGFGLVLLVTQAVYLQTMTISCPFWDSGEFIATSYILGIPHPPGTPLYVLIGRFFSLLPLFPEIATRVNWLSALASSLTAAFTYLAVVELWWRARRREAGGLAGSEGGSAAGPGRAAAVAGVELDAARAGVARGSWRRAVGALPGEWPGVVAGVVAGLFTAFGRTFWDNAIEAEVYALSSLIMALSAWLILKWGRWEGDRRGKNGLFVLLYYLICLSMGIHLGTFLVLPGIILFALLVDRGSFGEGRGSAWFVAGLVLLLHPGMLPTLGLKVWGPLVGLVLLSGLLFGGKWPAVGRRGVLLACLVMALVGISTHFYLMIRAGQNPAINEADPQTWDALWKVLTRDQYKPANPFVERQAPWSVQLTKHFWEYARDQYALGLRPRWVGWYLPYLLGLFGLWGQWRRDRQGFALTGVSYLIMSLGLVFYLNFKTDEVRPRDYFFVASYQFFAMWIGLGAAWLVSWLRRTPAAGPGSSRSLAWAGGLLLCALPLLTCRHYWFEHDRTEFFVARDFAANMLEPLKPDAILFTNGDNDTFPLWYLQQVEKVRKDVTVANLSLLNTEWYLRQLRDFAPKVDLGWSDGEIARLRPYLDARTQRAVYLKDMAVHRAIEREYGRRPIYFAATVPDLMGLEDRLVMQGVAFELGAPGAGAGGGIDADLTIRLARDTYRFRGLLKPDGTSDESVYKDENTRRLTQNYAAGLVRAAQVKLEEGDVESAETAMRLAGNLTPWSKPIQQSLAILLLRLQRYDDAEALLGEMVGRGVEDSRIYRLYGRALEGQDRMGEAETAYRRALEVDPQNAEVLMDLASFLWQIAGRTDAATELLRDWDRRYPGDRRIQTALRELATAAATESETGPGSAPGAGPGAVPGAAPGSAPGPAPGPGPGAAPGDASDKRPEAVAPEEDAAKRPQGGP